MFIQIETTPNPNTLKFLPGQPVLGQGTKDFTTIDAAEGVSPLAFSLFSIDGVKTVMLGGDFVAISKHDDSDWAHLKPHVLSLIMDHYLSGLPVIEDTAMTDTDINTEEEFFDPEHADTVELIKGLLETRVRPAVAMDGGDITFQGFKGGVVYLKMKGACAGCPSSTITLQHGIQNLLTYMVPEVKEVRPV